MEELSPDFVQRQAQRHFHFQSFLTYLVFVQFTVLILLLSLLLESDDDEAHKYIHHEEGNKDEVDDKED